MVWVQEGPERAGSPALPGRAESFSLLSMQMFPGGGGPDPATCWEPPASLCPGAENPDWEEGVHHVSRLTVGPRVGCEPANEDNTSTEAGARLWGWHLAGSCTPALLQVRAETCRNCRVRPQTHLPAPGDLGWRGGCAILHPALPILRPTIFKALLTWRPADCALNIHLHDPSFEEFSF